MVLDFTKAILVCKKSKNYHEIKQFLKKHTTYVLQYVDELSESKFVICSFIFSKSQIEKYTAMFYLIIGVFTVTQVEACSIISLDHKRIISRVRWNEVPTGPWHIVIHFFTEVCLIRVRQNVVWGGIVKKQNIVQIGVWFGCGIPDLQCQTSVAYKNT